MLKGLGQGINIRDIQRSSRSGKTEITRSIPNIPSKQEDLKTSDIITIGAKPVAETIVPFKANYAGLQERSIKKHLESYTLHDNKTGDNYSLKANDNGALAMFSEDPGDDTGQKLSLELKSNHSISLEANHSLLSPDPDEYYFFSR
jgi:hypothetical protein